MLAASASLVSGPVAMIVNSPGIDFGNLFAADLDARMRFDRAGDFLRERDAIHRQRLTSGNARLFRRAKQQRIEAAQLFLEQPGCRWMLIALQRIAADQFGQAVGLVGVGRAHGPHFVERDIDAALRELPCGFGAGEASADYCDVRLHSATANQVLVLDYSRVYRHRAWRVPAGAPRSSWLPCDRCRR